MIAANDVKTYILQMLEQKGISAEKIEVKHFQAELKENNTTGISSYISHHLNGFFFIIPEISYDVEIQISGQTEVFIYPDTHIPSYLSIPLFRKQLIIKTLSRKTTTRNIKFNVWQITVKP